MTELYRNEYYHINLVKEDVATPYHVIHSEHEVHGNNKFDNYPQSLIIAEQFNQMLHNDTWKRQMLSSSPELTVVEGGIH